jgi:hypothetical protein
MFINGYNPKRSGDIMFTFKPGYFDGLAKALRMGCGIPTMHKFLYCFLDGMYNRVKPTGKPI